MKRNLRTLVVVGLLCCMFLGLSVAVSAEGVVDPGHQCVFSNKGTDEYDGREITTHPYYVSDYKGNTSIVTCLVTRVWLREVWKCDCGKID